VDPFKLTFRLTRRQRLAVELMPWVPAVAATLGFGVGGVYLTTAASPCFLFLLAGPLLAYPGLFKFGFEIVFRGGRPVEVTVGETEFEVATGGERHARPLDGIFQVYQSGGVWTVLHLDGSVLTVPGEAITAEQVAYLRSFARKQAAARAREGVA
jgi:hypothetical protein